MKTVSYSPYSLDLTRSDFYLFRYIKVYLAIYYFKDENEPFEAVNIILNEIENVVL